MPYDDDFQSYPVFNGLAHEWATTSSTSRAWPQGRSRTGGNYSVPAFCGDLEVFREPSHDAKSMRTMSLWTTGTGS